MSKIIKLQRGRRGLIGLLGVASLVLVGCTGTEDGVTVSNVATPASLASESADNYDDNTYGLISGATLKSWIDDWTANRPAGITGKLVILQSSNNDTGYEFIKPDGVDVFTYHATEWVETRSNGVVQTKSMVPSGYSMDAFLSKYDIDPAEDMIVCSMGKGGTGTAMTAGRCWYMFRYWGTAKNHVAVLNGGNSWNGANAFGDDLSYFTLIPSTPTWAGRATVKDLPEINFALQATMEDLMNVVPMQDENLLDDGAFIWDARSTNQYSPTVDADFQSGPVQGHPNGALQLEFTNLLDATAGYTYKPKATLQSYMDGEEVDGKAFIDSTLQAVGANQAYKKGDIIYTYCETTYRAMITGFASAAILGLPTRFYDGAMTEWHSMSNVVDNLGDLILPINSPWRTDKVSWSMFIQRVDLTHANNVPVVIDDAYADSTNAIIKEDLEYKGIYETSDVASSPVSGGAPVPNGCGG